MREDTTISAIQFDNYKALTDYSVSLRSFNVLVGPNNSGKSTILGAVRVLAAGLRRAHSKSAQVLHGRDGYEQGYPIPEDELPISLENIHSNYSARASSVTFKLSNGEQLLLYFPANGEGALLMPGHEAQIMRPSRFRTTYPISIGVIPVLGPVEHNEPLVTFETVVRNLSSHRASRNFRNYWHYNPAEFDGFRALVERSWPGMSISRPEVVPGDKPFLTMFCKEHRIDRELYWVGFGFQVWCQLLTHIIRAGDTSLLVVDEPEIYLHPDLQRQLVRMLRQAGPDILLATHSTEIVNEAEPTQVAIVNKAWKSPRRVSIEGVQTALEAIGSGVNVTLTQLARTRRVLFVEGEDFKLMRRFVERIGLSDLATGLDMTPVSVGGFGSWKKIIEVSWGLERTLGSPMALAAVFDRDYFCDEEIDDVLTRLRKSLSFAFIHRRKEIENYLLVPSALDRAVDHALRDRARRTKASAIATFSAAPLLQRVTEPFRNEVRRQTVGNFVKCMRIRQSSVDETTVSDEAMQRFDEKWEDFSTRLEIVSGKKVFARFNELVRSEFGVSVSASAVVSSMKPADVAADLVATLQGIDRFRVVAPPDRGTPASTDGI